MIGLPKVVGGQSPFATLLSCADSRVSVEILFDHASRKKHFCRLFT